MSAPASVPPEAPCDWMRLFAVRLAHRRPDISADEVVRIAIRAHRVASGHLSAGRAAAAHTGARN